MSKNFYEVGGSLPANSKTYIERGADNNLYNSLKESKYCYVLNARQVGKSSLRVQVSQRLTTHGYKCVNIDITRIGSKNIDIDKWYASFVFAIIKELELPRKEFNEFWRSISYLTVIDRFSQMMDKILDDCSDNIVIFIDEIDSLLSIDIFSTDDFFAVIRTFYNLRSEDKRYNRLSFAIFGVATAEDLMEDPRRTPFNIAHSVKLTQLSFDQSITLTNGLTNQTIDTKEILQKVFEYTSGTPYLTQKLLDEISQKPISTLEEIDKIVDRVFIDSGFEERNIKNIQNRIVNSEKYGIKMLHLISEILSTEVASNDSNQTQIYLKLSGLIKTKNQKLVYNNKIYEMIFTKDWLDNTISKIDRPWSQDLHRWKELDRDKSALMRGEVLKKAREWAEGRDDLSDDEHIYLRKSIEEKHEAELYLTRHTINERLSHMDVQVERDKYCQFAIPKTKDESIEINSDLLKKYDILDSKITQKNSAIVQVLLNLNSFDYQATSYWITTLKDMDEQQKNKLFNILKEKIINQYFELASKYKKDTNYNKERDIYLQINESSYLEYYESYYSLGKIYAHQTKYPESILVFKQAVEMKPQRENAYLRLGIIYTNIEQYSEAVAIYNDLIKINPKSEDAYMGLGGIHDKRQEYTEAIEIYKKLIMINSKRSDVYLALGHTYKSIDEYDQAITNYEKAATHNFKKIYEPYSHIGFIHKEQDNKKEAIKAFEKALENKEFDKYQIEKILLVLKEPTPIFTAIDIIDMIEYILIGFIIIIGPFILITYVYLDH